MKCGNIRFMCVFVSDCLQGIQIVFRVIKSLLQSQIGKAVFTTQRSSGKVHFSSSFMSHLLAWQLATNESQGSQTALSESLSDSWDSDRVSEFSQGSGQHPLASVKLRKAKLNDAET